ncbi:MAG: cation transporter [Gammaproteobacteria bacterium]|nr:cation transporter [Gammaproteobacteria bacterium]MBU1655859.1 cation transporter [Gammaproteobacteria bacterium]MBU1960094.1 cation transporter [Gammaproteobacteria bacterium]
MIKLKIDGMNCGHCKAAVEQALKGVAGVGAVQVDLEAGEAAVEGDLDAAALVSAVEDKGYDARVI